MADIKELKAARLKKLKALRDLTVEPYPEKTPRHTPILTLLEEFSARKRLKKSVTATGRIMGMRGHGGLAFLDLRDGSGQIQVLAMRDNVDTRTFKTIELLDLGDFISVTGVLTRTNRGEKSIKVERLLFLAKALRPLPDTWYGLKDVDERFRDREVDFILNPKAAKILKVRSKLLSALRTTLEKEDFLEVETPILQTIPGGATARPFKTKLHALDLTLYLRIAPELYLKRLVVGGFERVYELGRVFRNEGMDMAHNPEFTMLEFYWAYQDLEGLMRFTERLLREAVKAVTGSGTTTFQGKRLDFTKRFPRIEYAEALKRHTGFNVFEGDQKELERAAKRFAVPVKDATKAQVIDHLFKKVVIPKLERPTFVIHHPVVLSPLAKRSAVNELTTQRMQVLAGGFEIVNAYAELNDPQDQKARFNAEREHRRAGDDEAQRTDLDFIRALEYGLPPTGGFGLGVDRFLMLLVDASSIREVIAFPTMRPKKRA